MATNMPEDMENDQSNMQASKTDGSMAGSNIYIRNSRRMEESGIRQNEYQEAPKDDSKPI